MDLCPYCFAQVYPVNFGFYCSNCCAEFPHSMAVDLPELSKEISEIEDILKGLEA